MQEQQLKGYLYKLSPAFFTGYQKRFFIQMRNQLAYFADESDIQPKGSISLNHVKHIKKIDTLEFEIIMDEKEKNYHLKADSQTERNSWFKWLEKAISLAKQNNDENESQILKLEMIQEEKKDQNYEQYKNNQLKEQNEKMYELKGIDIYFNDIEQEMMENGSFGDMLLKENKYGYTQKTWFFVISNYPIFDQKSERIQQSDLPPWMSFNVLYYFDPSNDEGPKGEIIIQDSFDITEFKTEKCNYSFKIDMGERIYIMNCESNKQQQTWIEILKQVQKNSKTVDKNEISEDLEKIVKIYEKHNSLHKFVDNFFFQKNLEFQQQNQDKSQTFEANKEHFVQLIEYQMNIIQDCQEFNCLDVQLIFFTDFNQRLLNEIKKYYKQDLQLFQLNQLADFLYQYEQQVKQYFLDKRLKASWKKLLNQNLELQLKNLKKVIRNIHNNEVKQAPEENEDQQLATMSPIDIYKLINEAYDINVSQFNTIEMILLQLKLAKQIIQYYQTLTLGKLNLEDIIFYKQNQLIALCNNFIQFASFCKDFEQKVLNETSINEQTIDKYFERKQILIDFNKINQKCFLKLTQSIFNNQEKALYDNFKNNDFIQFEFYKYFEIIITDSLNIYQKFHSNFQSKFIVQIIKQLIINIIFMIIQSCLRYQDYDLIAYNQKIDEIYQTLENELDSFSFKKALMKSIQPLKIVQKHLNSRLFNNSINYAYQILEFMDKTDQDTMFCLLKIKKDFGFYQQFLDVQSIKNIIYLLEEKFKQKQTQNDQIQQEEIHDDINDLENNQQESENDDSEEDEDQSNISLKRSKTQFEQEFKNESFLYFQEKSGNQKNYTKYYVKLRGEIILLFKNQNDTESNCKFDLKNAVVCEPSKNSPNSFKIILEIKKIKFKAYKPQLQQAWVNAISDIMSTIKKSRKKQIKKIKIRVVDSQEISIFE